MSYDFFRLQNEILSFDLQFYNIEIKKRKVTKKFLRGIVPPARKLMEKLKGITIEDTVDSYYALGLIKTLRERQTIKYFEKSDLDKELRY